MPAGGVARVEDEEGYLTSGSRSCRSCPSASDDRTHQIRPAGQTCMRCCQSLTCEYRLGRSWISEPVEEDEERCTNWYDTPKSLSAAVSKVRGPVHLVGARAADCCNTWMAPLCERAQWGHRRGLVASREVYRERRRRFCNIESSLRKGRGRISDIRKDGDTDLAPELADVFKSTRTSPS